MSKPLEPSYPTQSLRFLQKLESPKSKAEVPKAAVILNIIIVGAGLGGLSTAIALRRNGHNVTVLEQASALGEVSPYIFSTKSFLLTLPKGRSGYSSTAKLDTTSSKLGNRRVFRQQCC